MSSSLARRQRRAAKTPASPKPFPGTATCCPKCFSNKVATADNQVTRFYSRTIAVCGACGAAWEPVPEDLIWDRSDPASSLRDPCDNCAFRPGSHEQSDKDEWKTMIANLREGAQFYCHKGVPITPSSEHGFAYPKKNVTVELDGVPSKTIDVPDTKHLRLCRGYLNALGKWWSLDKPTGETA